MTAISACLLAAGVLADGFPARYGFKVIAEFEHDPAAFTQGLVYHRGFLYESTGRYGQSSLRKVELESGKVLAMRPLPERFFGEGLAVVGDRLVQLTWRERTGFVYDIESLALLKTFHYPIEGWGLAYDGTRLLMSDGSATLYHLDPETFGLIGRLEVRDSDGPVYRLNELEFVEGYIYANVWHREQIAKIDPASGRVVAWIDLEGLRPSGVSDAGVLNGIAFDPANRRFLVTGKLWPKLFAIDIVEN